MFDDVFLVRRFPCGHRIPRSNLHSRIRLASVLVYLVLHAWCDEHRSCTSMLTASYVNADAVRATSCIVPRLP